MTHDKKLLKNYRKVMLDAHEKSHPFDIALRIMVLSALLILLNLLMA